VAQLLRKVLLNGSVGGGLKEEPGLEFCYKMGWLQAELVLQEGFSLGTLLVEFLPKRNLTYDNDEVGGFRVWCREVGSRLRPTKGYRRLGLDCPKRTVYSFPTRMHQR
jgi:hypothetical protein